MSDSTTNDASGAVQRYAAHQVKAAIKVVEEQIQDEKAFLKEERLRHNQSDTLELYKKFLVDFENGMLPETFDAAQDLADQVYTATQEGSEYSDSDISAQFGESLCAALELDEDDIETEE